ncbi:MAG TPA: hypothetical protein VK879_10735 [Candidatus Sulfomarinibacteraceae bacterium]|nr:hypothetical protein [Candidatus Sulfomarinibacteraceae bacterium]
MAGVLSLRREDLIVDRDLLARLPAGLAAYYLALPLACEDGAISVAMAHPDNKTGLAVLGDLLGAPVVPVHVRAEALRGALQLLYDHMPAPAPQVLCWSDGGASPPSLAGVAAAFAAALSGPVTTLSSPDLDARTVLTIAHRGRYSLAVLSPAPNQPWAPLLERASLPLFLLRRNGLPCGNPLPLRHVLVVLRGYASDCYVLEWLAPFLGRPTMVTLLPLPHSRVEEALLWLPHNNAGESHLDHCLRHPVLEPARTFIRMRQGPALQQGVDEIQQEQYDLVAITAEGYGHFVSDVLTTMEQRGIGNE